MSASGKLRHSIESLRERQLWVGQAYYADVRPRLCKARFLRIAAVRLTFRMLQSQPALQTFVEPVTYCYSEY